MKLRSYLLILFTTIVLVINAWAGSGTPTMTEMVRMRDGARLVTDIYLPEGKGPWPAVVMRTPYTRKLEYMDSLLKGGYAVVIQSIRGRFGSEGTERLVFLDDGWGENQDGYDCVEWVAKQQWCNGKIATVGASASGITQYLMAGSTPPSLKCQVVAVAAPSLYHYAVFPGGAFRLEQVKNWLAGNSFDQKQLRVMIEHPSYDRLWQALDLTTRPEKVCVPILHIAGWYDTFLQGNLDAFTLLQRQGGTGAKGNHKIIVGPWGHGERKKIGAFEYPNSEQPKEPNLLAWLDHWVKGIDNGVEKSPSVHYYTVGAIGEKDALGNEWRTSDVWPIPAVVTPFYLHKDGFLSKEMPRETTTIGKSYVFDPKNPVPTVGGNNLTIAKGPLDQRKVEQRKDVVIFETPVLQEPLEVTGRINVKLWASSTGKDTDFTAKLADVYPDGRSMNVCDGIIRARYRKFFENPELLVPGEIYEFEIDLWSTSIVFNKGHKIRLAISSSNYPRFDVNPNTGELPSTAQSKIAVRNTIYCDQSHPSAVYLPIVHNQ